MILEVAAAVNRGLDWTHKSTYTFVSEIFVCYTRSR